MIVFVVIVVINIIADFSKICEIIIYFNKLEKR